MIIAPIQHLAQIELAEANRALADWSHQMGPCNRPTNAIWAHGMFEHGNLVAVTVTSSLIRETAAGFTRDEAIELARLCAERPGLCRIMLRLWQEMVMPAYGTPWAVSYQDETLHSGAIYRFNGWVIVGRSRSGTDARSGRKGRNKTIWGWHGDDAVRGRCVRAGFGNYITSAAGKKVAFHFKQWGEWTHQKEDDYSNGERAVHVWSAPDRALEISVRVGKKAAGHLLDGVAIQEFPA
jgi:antitoxin VapB